MENDRLARYGAATGIVFVILLVIGFGGLVLPNVPKTDASGQEWAAYFTDHQERIQTGVVLLGLAVFFFVWSLGSLRSVLVAAEGGAGAWPRSPTAEGWSAPVSSSSVPLHWPWRRSGPRRLIRI